MGRDRKRNWVTPNVEPLGDRILPVCLTSFSGGLLTVACNADNDGIYMKSDASGRIYLNGVAIPGNPTVSNTSQISVAGGAGNDKINLSGITNWNGRATIVGGTGNDILTDAPGKSDSLYGGNDNDILTAGFGNDTLNAGAGIDRIAEVFDTNFKLSNGTMIGLGTDLLSGIEQASLTGGAGDNTINATAFAGSATLKGANGNDFLIGGSNNDLLVGGQGNDRLVANNGNDTLSGQYKSDSLEGGNGIDLISEVFKSDMGLSDGSFAHVGGTDALDSIERAFLSGNAPVTDSGSVNQRISAIGFTAGPVTIVGGRGNDFLTGGPNDDSLFGGEESDNIQGARGNDTMDGGTGIDTVSERPLGFDRGPVHLTITDTRLTGKGDDSLRNFERADLGGDAFNLNDDILDASGFGGESALSGGPGNDSLCGGPANDRLNGGGGDDTLVGNSGTDILQGGFGNDSVLGGAGLDVFEEFRNTGDMTLTDTNFSVGSETDVLESIESARLSRTSNDPVRIDASGFSGPTTLIGGAGNDTLIGGSGNDSILGGNGNDSLVGNAGDDFFDGGFGTDTGVGGPGTDTFISVENQTQ